MFTVFVGYDAREDAAYQVCRQSLMKVDGVQVVPLKHLELRKLGLFDRPWLIEGPTGQFIDTRDTRPFSTEFSHTRFLVPHYAKHLGLKDDWVLFVDCDFLFRTSVAELFKLADPRYAVMACKHQYQTTETVKMDGMVQANYHRKNWSSLTLWNLRHPAHDALDLHAVNHEPGGKLHRFCWLKDEEIGGLPLSWNWIDGAVPHDLVPDAVHYSAGGPWFEGYQDVPYAGLWLAAQKQLRGA